MSLHSSQSEPLARAVAEFDNGHFLGAFLSDHLRNVNLKLQAKIPADAPDLRFTENEDFWSHVLSQASVQMKWIELTDFGLCDWFPRSPGLYHTPEARWQRAYAERYVKEKDGIWFYEPGGKTHMINGGIGSIRFKPIHVEGRPCQLCTASSDRLCHTGVPLAVPIGLLDHIDFDYKRRYRLMGQMRFLPDFLEHYFYHLERIPQIYVLVEELEAIGRAKTDVAITPMVFFQAQHAPDKAYRRDYVTYVTASSTDKRGLDRAADWIAWYVSQYDGRIVTNYDQQQPAFREAPFSLQNVMGGRLRRDSFDGIHIREAKVICDTVLKIQAQEVDMSENVTITIGDGNVFNGDAFIGNRLRDIYTKVKKGKRNKQLRSTLEGLTLAVTKMTEGMPKADAERVVNDLQTLSNEAVSPAPRRKWWQLSAEGLVEAAKAVGEAGKTVLDWVPKVLTILDKAT
jgi:hypothetical protein